MLKACDSCLTADAPSCTVAPESFMAIATSSVRFMTSRCDRPRALVAIEVRV